MSRRELVEDAFGAWMRGEGHVSALFAPEMTWEIAGRSAASGAYPDAAAFISEVLEPFGRRFPSDAPFRPVRIRRVLEDGDTVVVVWDGSGTTVSGDRYDNTYAWFLTFRGDRIVDGLAFYDSIAFDELWRRS